MGHARFASLLVVGVSVCLLAVGDLPAQVSTGTISRVDEFWTLRDVEVGWGPTGLSVTPVVGSVTLPLISLGSGNWSNPLLWPDVMVYYEKADQFEDTVTGSNWVEVDSHGVSTTWETFMDGWGPTERSITVVALVPRPFSEFLPIEVGIGTLVKYDVTVAHDLTLDQASTLESLEVGQGATLNVGDCPLTVPSPITNLGSIRKTAGAGTFTLANLPENPAGSLVDSASGTLTVTGDPANGGTMRATSGGSLRLTGFLSNTGTLEADSGGTVVVCGQVGNSGTLHAKDGGLVDLQANVANNGLICADAGGTLQIGAVVENAGSGIQCDGNTLLHNATINGGHLSGSGRYEVQVASTLADVTLAETTLGVRPGAWVKVHGALSDCTVELKDDSVLYAIGDVDLSGSGRVVMGTEGRGCGIYIYCPPARW